MRIEDLPRAHRDDPNSAWEAGAEAADSGRVRKHSEEVLSLVRAYPGLTGAELAALTDTYLDKYEIRRRLSELTTLGAVRQDREGRRCGIAERKACTYWPVPEQSRMPL